jgi:large subunit ribosomal protein L31
MSNFSQKDLDKTLFQPTFAPFQSKTLWSFIHILSVRQNPYSTKNQEIMKKGLHPGSYRLVVFKDMSNNHSFLSKSTADSKETVKWEDGNDYPLVKLEISNMSHPFFTGKNMLVDTAGRIDKFKKKYEKKK